MAVLVELVQLVCSLNYCKHCTLHPLGDHMHLLRWAHTGCTAVMHVSVSPHLLSDLPHEHVIHLKSDMDMFSMKVGTIPASEEALVKMILNDEEAKFNSADLNVAYKMSVDEYYKQCEYAEALEENWGKAPGQLNTNGQDLLIYGKQFGNVFIGVQPTFGYEGDPMRLLFSKSASPHHGFAAYYTFLEKIFDADAVLHFGTHGSLEFMPGKQVGMAGTCYPDNLIGNIPNLYYYAANNPSEATIAKRRSYANTISYLTPPAENAGLYKGLKELKELISSYQV